MSYSFDMTFLSVEEESNVLPVCVDIVDKCRESAKEIIKNNLDFVPSKCMDKKSTGLKRKIDDLWLYRLFSINFIWWKEKNLLGITGCLPEQFQRDNGTVCFQNGTDQDYDFSVWEQNKYLKKITFPYAKMSEDEIRDQLRELDYYDEDELQNIDFDYQRKSLAYDAVWKDLDLRN